MTPPERAVVFTCEGDRLIGILSEPAHARSDLGVIIIVGGPQYRVGSHRQFVHLARNLATEGWPTFRFDYRGMGDAEGDMRTFEQVGADIRAAIDAFVAAQPLVERVIVWGLCDGASAALLYAPTDERVSDLVLANPWVRSSYVEAATTLKHYYLVRARSARSWGRLILGKVNIVSAVRSVIAATSRILLRPVEMSTTQGFQHRMLEGWSQHQGRLLLLLSGNDMTAKEFLQLAATNPRWHECALAPLTERHDLPNADHTFSTSQSRSEVEHLVREWLRRLK